MLHKCEEYQLRDRIVTGLRDTHIIEKLLEEGNELTLAKTKTICESYESAKKKTAVIAGEESVSMMRKSEYSKQKTRFPSNRPYDTQKCTYCGLEHVQIREKCPAWGKKCMKCGKMNHYARNCKNGQFAIRQVVKNIQEEEDNREMVGSVMWAIESGLHRVTIDVRVLFGTGKGTLRFLPDTGASINAISLKDLQKLGENVQNLIESHIKPQSVEGRVLENFGKLRANIRLGGRQTQAEIYVLKNIKHPVLSLKTCKELNLIHQDFPKQMMEIKKPELNRMCVITEKGCQERSGLAEQLMKEFPVVFQGVISSMKGE